MTKFFQLKYVHNLILVLLCTLISSTLSACSDDDDDEQKVESKDFLVGTWKYKFSDDGFVYYTFNEDGSGRVYENDGGHIDQDETFTYIHYSKEFRFKYISEDGYIENVSYEKISDTRIIVYDFGDDVENWVKQ